MQLYLHNHDVLDIKDSMYTDGLTCNQEREILWPLCTLFYIHGYFPLNNIKIMICRFESESDT